MWRHAQYFSSGKFNMRIFVYSITVLFYSLYLKRGSRCFYGSIRKKTPLVVTVIKFIWKKNTTTTANRYNYKHTWSIYLVDIDTLFRDSSSRTTTKPTTLVIVWARSIPWEFFLQSVQFQFSHTTVSQSVDGSSRSRLVVCCLLYVFSFHSIQFHM